MSTTDLKRYTCKCHCGKFVYEFDHVPLETSKDLEECNCSICSNRAYVFAFAKEVHFTKGSKDELSSYSFGKGAYDHWFCPVCGSGLACNKKDGSQYGINLRLVEGVDVKKLTYGVYDGANLL